MAAVQCFLQSMKMYGRVSYIGVDEGSRGVVRNYSTAIYSNVGLGIYVKEN